MAFGRFFAKYSSRRASGKFDSDFFNKYTTFDYYLSKGASGNVYGPIQRQKMQLAIKQATFADAKVTEQFKKDMKAKIDIWISLKHKHLMRIYSVYLDQLPKAMFIVMEFAVGGALHKTLRSLNALPYDVVTDWAKQIAEGMLYLHEKNIVHRDLKSSNILLMETFSYRNPLATVTLKIADFDEVKKHDHTTTMSFVGTCAYMAPEVIREQWFSKASDVWSYGVVVWEMLSGDIPHKGVDPHTLMHKSITGQLGNLPVKKSVPDEFQLLLNKCWKPIYEERPSFQDILRLLDHKVSDDATTENRDDSDKKQLRAHFKKSEEERVALDDFRAESVPGINGLAVLGDDMFISRLRFSYMEVYDSTTFEFKRYIRVNGMTQPENIASCSVNNCLYTSNWDLLGQVNTILRIDPTDGHIIKDWVIEGRGGLLSVASDTNVILTADHSAKLHEFTADGVLVRNIDLGVGTQIRIFRAWYAVKLDDGQFVACYGCEADLINRVGILKIKETSNALGRTDEVEIQKEFCEGEGEAIILEWPMYVSVNKERSILVSDLTALLLNSDLDKPRILYGQEHGMGRPSRTCFDESTGQWFLSDTHHVMVCREERDKVEVKLYDPRLKAWVLKSFT